MPAVLACVGSGPVLSYGVAGMPARGLLHTCAMSVTCWHVLQMAFPVLRQDNTLVQFNK